MTTQIQTYTDKQLAKLSDKDLLALMNELKLGTGESILNWGKVTVVFLDRHPKDGIALLHSECGLPYNTIGTLDRIGRGKLLPELVFEDCPGARMAMKLSPDQQAKAISEPIQVAVVESGDIVLKHKTLQELSQSEAKMVFADGHIATPAEQAEKLKHQKTIGKIPQPDRYKIDDDGTLVVLEPTKFSLSRLEEVFEQAKAKALKSLQTPKRQ